VLEAALSREPENSRYVFYLGRSYFEAGERSRAKAAFLRRVDMGGFVDEIYLSLVYLGAIAYRETGPSDKVAQAYLAAHAANPTRAEALCAAADVYRALGDPRRGLDLATRACEIAIPECALFVSVSAYTWRPAYVAALAAGALGEMAIAGKMAERALAARDMPEEFRASLRLALGAAALSIADRNARAGA
jgi:hypothetical protein